MTHIKTDKEHAEWLVQTHDTYGIEKSFQVYGDYHGPDKLEEFKKLTRQAWLDQKVKDGD